MGRDRIRDLNDEQERKSGVGGLAVSGLQEKRAPRGGDGDAVQPYAAFGVVLGRLPDDDADAKDNRRSSFSGNSG